MGCRLAAGSARLWAGLGDNHMAYFTRAQSNPQFPSNLPNPNYQYPDLGNTLDSVYNAYLQSKQMGMRENAEKDRQGAELLQFGFNPRDVTPEVLARSQPGMAPQGPAQQGMQSPAQAENPLFGAVRSFLEKKKSADSMAVEGRQVDMDVKRSEIVKNLREPAASVRTTPKPYKAADGKNRIGMWTPQGLVTNPDDPLASEYTMAMPDKSEQAMMAKARSTAANARAAIKTMGPELDRIKGLNTKSRAGLIGEAKQRVSSALNVGQDDPEYKNTVETINSLQAMVAKVLKSTFGGQLSDGERNYLREVYGASARYTQKERDTAIETIRRMMTDASTQADSALSELSAGSSTAGHSAPKQDHSALLDKYGAP